MESLLLKELPAEKADLLAKASVRGAMHRSGSDGAMGYAHIRAGMPTSFYPTLVQMLVEIEVPFVKRTEACKPVGDLFESVIRLNKH